MGIIAKVVAVPLLFAACGGRSVPATPTPLSRNVTFTVFLDENRNGTLEPAERIRIPGADISFGAASGKSLVTSGEVILSVLQSAQVLSVTAASLPPYHRAPESQAVTPPLDRGLNVPVVLPLGPDATPGVFLAFGDSITRGEDGSNLTAPSSRFYPRVILPDAQTYPVALLQSLRDRYITQSPIVTNQGKPSEAVTDPGTLDRFVSFTSSGQYDAALIMEGTNDLFKARNVTGNPNGVLGSAAAGLRSMVGDAKSRNIRPFLATIPPMNPAGSRGAVYGAEFVTDFNERIRSIAAAENVALVDVHLAFGGNLALLSADGVHPNPGGYQKIADAFLAAIKSTAEVSAPASASLRRR